MQKSSEVSKSSINILMLLCFIAGIMLMTYWLNLHGITMNDLDIFLELDSEILPGQIAVLMLIVPLAYYLIYLYKKNVE